MPFVNRVHLSSAFRHASRRLLRRPGLSATVILTMGLGIGVNCSIVALAYALGSRPPAELRDPRGLVQILWRDESGYESPAPLEEFHDLASGSRTLTSLTIYGRRLVRGVGDDEFRAIVHATDTAYFSILGIAPRLGRMFDAAEWHAAGDSPVCLISSRLWRQAFHRRNDVIGRTVVLGSGETFTVIGVTPDGFIGPESSAPADIWIADARAADVPPWYAVIGRLSRETGVDAATRDVRDVLARTASTRPATRARLATEVRRLGSGVHPEQEPMIRGLIVAPFTVAALILFIASLNVAGLLFTQAASRQRELAIRAALGASRVELIVDLLIDTLILVGCGGVLALGLIGVTSRMLLRFTPTPVSLSVSVAPDAVLVLALGGFVAAAPMRFSASAPRTARAM